MQKAGAGRAYQSDANLPASDLGVSTGPNGIPVEISMQRLQDENENPLLMIKEKEFKGDHNEY
jgi:hypothetical protein